MNSRTINKIVLVGDIGANMRIRVWEPDRCDKTLFCIHGFAGTGQDFEILARSLVKGGFRVVAPDILGRGESTFLGDGARYNLRTYVRCITALSSLRKAQNYHLGSSWGGAILLAYLAATGFQSNGLILNDIPIKSDTNLTMFRNFLNEESQKVFPTRAAAAEHLLTTRSMNFLTEPDRGNFIDARIMETEDGWRMRYDPATTQAFGGRSDFSFEELLRKLPCPALMTFGNRSPYVDKKTLDSICSTNPAISVVTDMDDPHPPSLMKSSQVLQIAGFLSQLG